MNNTPVWMETYSDVMDGRSASDFSSFEVFWQQFDEAMHYDAADNDESVEDFRDEIQAFFNEDLTA